MCLLLVLLKDDRLSNSLNSLECCWQSETPEVDAHKSNPFFSAQKKDSTCLPWVFYAKTQNGIHPLQEERLCRKQISDPQYSADSITECRCEKQRWNSAVRSIQHSHCLQDFTSAANVPSHTGSPSFESTSGNKELQALSEQMKISGAVFLFQQHNLIFAPRSPVFLREQVFWKHLHESVLY